jgi:hypothetical protein
VDDRGRRGVTVEPFGSKLIRWRAVGGGTASDGTTVGKPPELAQAELILGILERFPGYTLSTLYEEDAELLRLLKIEEMGRRDGEHH